MLHSIRTPNKYLRHTPLSVCKYQLYTNHHWFRKVFSVANSIQWYTEQIASILFGRSFLKHLANFHTTRRLFWRLFIRFVFLSFYTPEKYQKKQFLYRDIYYFLVQFDGRQKHDYGS